MGRLTDKNAGSIGQHEHLSRQILDEETGEVFATQEDLGAGPVAAAHLTGAGDPVNQATYQVTLPDGVNGGTLRLYENDEYGEPTDDIPFDADGDAVTESFVSNFGDGNVTATGAAGGPWVITFTGENGRQALDFYLDDNSLLVGGETPSEPTIETIAAGGSPLAGPAQADYWDSDAGQLYKNQGSAESPDWQFAAPPSSVIALLPTVDQKAAMDYATNQGYPPTDGNGFVTSDELTSSLPEPFKTAKFVGRDGAFAGSFPVGFPAEDNLPNGIALHEGTVTGPQYGWSDWPGLLASDGDTKLVVTEAGKYRLTASGDMGQDDAFAGGRNIQLYVWRGTNLRLFLQSAAERPTNEPAGVFVSSLVQLNVNDKIVLGFEAENLSGTVVLNYRLELERFGA